MVAPGVKRCPPASPRSSCFAVAGCEGATTRFFGRALSRAPKAANTRKKAATRTAFLVHSENRPSCLVGLLALAVRELFADARGFPRAATQIVELGAAHVALAFDFDASDEWRVRLKSTLDAFAAGDFAHDERRVEATVALGDNHTLVRLYPLTLAFHHVDVDNYRVAWREFGDRLA